jgi:hypothetical protein
MNFGGENPTALPKPLAVWKRGRRASGPAHEGYGRSAALSTACERIPAVGAPVPMHNP